MRIFLDAYPTKAHPMGILSAAVCTLSTFYPESQKKTDLQRLLMNHSKVISQITNSSSLGLQKLNRTSC